MRIYRKIRSLWSVIGLVALLFCVWHLVIFDTPVREITEDHNPEESAVTSNPKQEVEQVRLENVPTDVSYKKYKWPGLSDALAARASGPNRLVVLALVDSGYLDMACNFYLSSIKRFGIRNFLFVAADAVVCDSLQKALGSAMLPCFSYKSSRGGDGPAPSYGTQEFRLTVSSRNALILRSLELGFTILNTDTDIVYLQNPLPDIIEKCRLDNCDIAALDDNGAINAGFIYLRPTTASVGVYRTAVAEFRRKMQAEQGVINQAINDQRKRKGGIRVVYLSRDTYQSGRSFFGARSTPYLLQRNASHEGIMVVHNNCIKGTAIKILRFRQHRLWFYDKQRYYSDNTRNYLAILDPVLVSQEDGKYVYDTEWETLRKAFAIAILLNRTLILPDMVDARGTPLTYTVLLRFSIERFNTAFSYRESVFLEHPRIPQNFKESVSCYDIEALPRTRNFGASEQNSTLEKCQRVLPRDVHSGPSEGEIRSWLSTDPARVLVLVTLRGKYKHLPYDRLFTEEGMAYLQKKEACARYNERTKHLACHKRKR